MALTPGRTRPPAYCGIFNRTWAVPVTLLGLAASCAPSVAMRPATLYGRPRAAAVSGPTLTFTNRRPESVTVYVATESGSEWLLGRVEALKTAIFSVPRGRAREGTLAYIVVVPIGTWHTYMSRKALIPDAIISEAEPIQELFVKRWDLAGRQLAGFIAPPPMP